MDAPSALLPMPSPQASFWKSVRDAIAGTHQDYTEGKLNRAIFLLAIPMILEMVMESLFGIVNVFWVSRLGSEAITVVGLTESMFTLVFAVATGLSIATTATVARRIGEKHPSDAAVAAVQSILIGVVVSGAVAITGMTNAPRLLELMGASRDAVRTGSSYTALLLGGSAGVFLLFLNNAILRGAGDASLAMRALWIGNVVNMLLDPCLIFGLGPFPALGITGAAVATTIGRFVGVGYTLYALTSGRARVVIRREQVRVNVAVLSRLLRMALKGMFQYAIATASWLALVRLTATFGDSAVAGYTIAIRIIVFAILPSWGLSNAAATLVGQNLGARKPDRAENAVWRTGLYNMAFLGTVSVVFITFASWIISWFTTDPRVAPIAVECLRDVSYGYVAYAWGMVLVQAFNGAGDTLTPTLINLLCYWCWQIPLAYGLSTHIGLGPRGVFLAIAISEATLAVIGVLTFRMGRWKMQKV